MKQKEREERWRENSCRSNIIGKVLSLLDYKKIPYDKSTAVLFAQDMIMQGKYDPEDIVNSWKLEHITDDI